MSTQITLAIYHGSLANEHGIYVVNPAALERNAYVPPESQRWALLPLHRHQEPLRGVRPESLTILPPVDRHAAGIL